MSVRGLIARVRGGADRGAVAVEAGLVLGFIIVPLLLGVLFYGNYFWKAQKVSTLDYDGIPPESASGSYNCEELTTRVKSLLASNTAGIASQLGVPASAIRYTVRNINALPDVSIGVDLTVDINVDLESTFGISGPLPANGTVSTSFSQQLPNVKLSTTSC